MTLAARQTALVDYYAIIPDPQERLSLIISRSGSLPALPAEDQTDAHLVHGCQSRVWITCRHADGLCHFRSHAESPLVRGLVALLCELHDSLPPAEILGTEPTLLEALGLTRQLSPTRLHGLASVRNHLRQLAATPPQP